MPPSHFDSSTVNSDPPAVHLEIDHVYGYRTRGSRDNVHWIDPPTTFLYIAASVGVVCDWPSRTQKFYTGHSDDICCAAFNPRTRMAATGGLGKRNTAPICIWSVDSMKTHRVLRGQLEFNVVSVAFSQDGSRLLGLGADNTSSIALYDVQSGALLAHSKGDSNRILHLFADTTVGRDSRKHFVSIGVSHVKFWNKEKEAFAGKKAIGGGIYKQTCVSGTCTSQFVIAGNVSGSAFVFSSTTLVKVVPLHSSFCGALAFENGVLLSGGRDGILRQWTIDDTGVVKEILATNLNPWNGCSVPKPGGRPFFNCPRAISHCPAGTVTGTSLGSIYVMLPDGEIHTVLDSHFEDQPGAMPELWGLAVHPTEPLFATVSQDATLRLWSVELGNQILVCDVFYRGCCCAFDPAGSLIAVGHENGSFSVWDAMTLTPAHPFTRKRHFQAKCCSFSPNGRLLAVGMGLSHIVDLYDAKREFVHVVACDALSGLIKQLDWSNNGKMLRCATGSYELVHFNIPSGEMNQSLESADESWSSQTCFIGWGVQGIWEGCSDGTDVNAVNRSPCGSLLVAGYDMCTVRLFNFPCLPKLSDRSTRVQFPEHREYGGHSSHVTNCAFTSDGKFVLSTGGMDQTIIRWRISSTTISSSTKPKTELTTEKEDTRKIYELEPDTRATAAARMSGAVQREEQFGKSSSTTVRRPGTGNQNVRSRLLEATASSEVKASVGNAQRKHADRQNEIRKRMAF